MQRVCGLTRTFANNSMTLGFVHEVVRDGKVTYVEDKDAVACRVNRDTFDEETGKFKTEIVTNGVSNEAAN